MASSFDKAAVLSTNNDGTKDELMTERFVLTAQIVPMVLIGPEISVNITEGMLNCIPHGVYQ